MELSTVTKEKILYSKYWVDNAKNFEKQGCYSWMAEKLSQIRPSNILDIGCGSGEGLSALVQKFNPSILSIEENAACIRTAVEKLKLEGIDVGSQYRMGYEPQSDGSHIMHFDGSEISIGHQVSILHSDFLLVDCDKSLVNYLASSGPYDAVTAWLIGTYKWREDCQNIRGLNIRDPNDYRLRIQNRVYEVAARFLRPGGLLQIVDRGEPPNTRLLGDDLIRSHREQAEVTDLEVFDLDYRLYKEVTDRGISMIASPGESGRIPDIESLAVFSVLSRKP